MHILGKVLLWLCVVLFIPTAIVLTTMLLDIRSTRLAEVEDLQQQVEESIQQLADARVQTRRLEEDVQQLTQDWGDVWVAGNSRPEQGGRRVQIGAGTNQGIPAPPQNANDPFPVVYVFADQADGASQYLGEFVVTGTQPDQTIASLTREPFPGETENWPAGVYHVRSNLPSNWTVTMADLNAQQAIAQSKLNAQQLQLEILTNQIQASQQALDQRLMELNGNPAAPPEAPEEIQLGLVEALRQKETDRNQLLAEVDVLRRDLDRKYVELRKTLEENREMMRKLQEEAGVTPVESGDSPTQAQRAREFPSLTTAANR